jgi:alkanesulfonate monooxygenase SsuD/methylene tetrahydromethanopterin reductase-like flavin-dependent oxidoreductase (luciferase family)
VGVKAGAVIWGQNNEWPGLRDAAARADALGYDSLWT